MIISYVHRIPTPKEHRALAERVGWADSLRWDRVWMC